VSNAAGNTCTDLDTGEIVRERPLPDNPNTNPCPELNALDEESGRCEQVFFPHTPTATSDASLTAPSDG
jgi:hypothetical protein